MKKFISRKFLIAVSSILTTLGVILSNGVITQEDIAIIITNSTIAISYILGETYIDAKNKK
jgi:hypothetical protein